MRTPLPKIHPGFCYPLWGRRWRASLRASLLRSLGGDSSKGQLEFRTPTPTSSPTATTTHPKRVEKVHDMAAYKS